MVAAVGAVAVCVALRKAYPDALGGRTDVVGYPTFARFNVRVYFVNYFLVVVAFPVATLLLYAGIMGAAARLGRARRRLPLLPAVMPVAPPADPDPADYSWPVALGRSAFVGAILAAGAVIAVDARPDRVVPVALLVTAAYAGTTCAVAWACSRRRGAVPSGRADGPSIDGSGPVGEPDVPAVGDVGGSSAVSPAAAARATRGARSTARWLPAAAASNALAAPFAVLALLAASEASTVTVLTTGRVEHFRWLPVPVAVGAVVVGVAVVAHRLWRTPRERWPAVERWAVLLGPGPVAVWLLTSGLNMNVGGMDVFHEGEVLAATQRVADGAFPWRDVLFIHGLIGDVVPGLIARGVFGDTRWAVLASGGALLNPLFWVGNYFLCVWLFRRNWVLLLTSQALVVLGALPFFLFRMVLQAYLLLLLAALLQKATWLRAAGVAVVAVAQFVLAPEASYFSLAACAVVVVYDVVHRRPGQRLVVAFARTLRVAAAGAAASAVFLAVLVGNDALDPFLDYYRTFVSGHELSGGLPIARPDTGWFFDFWMVAPVALVLATWWYVAARVRSGRWLTTQDWVVLAAVAGVVPYYSKFLSRAESGHLGQVAATAMVPLLYVGYRLVDEAELPFRRRRAWALPVSASALVAAVAFSPGSAGALLEGLPGRWHDVADHESSLQRVGYEDASGIEGPGGAAGMVDPRVVHDLDAVLDAYVGDGGSVFDFTNSPGLFGFLLDQHQATRYFHVSMAVPEAVQRDLVAELERDRPEIVVFDSIRYGMPGWDGVPNPVRHYLVSEYLLDNYEPLVGLHGFTLLRRAEVPEVPLPLAELSEAPVTDDLYLGPRACDWGYSPGFLRLEPADDARRVDVAVRAAGPVVSAQGWAVDGRARTPVREVLVVVRGHVVDRFTPSGVRPDVAALLADPAATASGFTAAFPLTTRAPRAADVRLYGLTESGDVGEIARGDGRRPSPDHYLIDGTTTRPVVPGAVFGYMDKLDELGATYVLDLPADARAYDWLEVETAEPLRDDRLTLDDPTGAAAHSITFRTLPGDGHEARVMVGACSQWQGYDDTLLLRSESGQQIRSVQIVRSG